MFKLKNVLAIIFGAGIFLLGFIIWSFLFIYMKVARRV